VAAAAVSTSTTSPAKNRDHPVRVPCAAEQCLQIQAAPSDLGGERLELPELSKHLERERNRPCELAAPVEDIARSRARGGAAPRLYCTQRPHDAAVCLLDLARQVAGGGDARGRSRSVTHASACTNVSCTVSLNAVA
jgi:hypothetical protein